MAAEPGRASARAVTLRLQQRSVELRRAWAHKPSDDITGEVRRLIQDIVESGALIHDEPSRMSAADEIMAWQEWFVSTQGEFVDPGAVNPFRPSDGKEYEPIAVDKLIDDLEMGYTVHRRLIQGADFSTIEPRRLAEAFVAGQIVNCRFVSCDFRNVEFSMEEVRAGNGLNLIYVEFVDCKFRRSRWSGLRASSLAFKDTGMIYEADFSGASFADVLFQNFGGKRARFPGASFTECNFSDVAFEESYFTGATFSWCRFERATFTACDLSQTAFLGCDLRGTVFAGGSLQQALFSECGLEGLRLELGPLVGGLGKGRSVPVVMGMQWETSLDIPKEYERMFYSPAEDVMRLESQFSAVDEAGGRNA